LQTDIKERIFIKIFMRIEKVNCDQHLFDSVETENESQKIMKDTVMQEKLSRTAPN
jgi:hypothetical protein